jgi:hypothetical protein
MFLSCVRLNPPHAPFGWTEATVVNRGLRSPSHLPELFERSAEPVTGLCVAS